MRGRRGTIKIAVGAGVLVVAWLISTRMVGNDLAVFRRGAQALLDGHDPFAMHGDQLPFVYPPFAAALFVPLATLTQHAALVVMTALSLVSLGVVVRRCSTAVWPESTAATRRATAAIVLVLAVSDPVLGTLKWGQINLLLMAMVVVDLVRPKPSRHQGVLIGVAAGIKIIPALFVVYLVVSRRFRAAALAILTFVATVAVGALVLPGESVSFWLGGTATDPSRFPIPTVGNQSILGTFARLTGLEGTRGWWLLLCGPIVGAAIWLAVRVRERFGEIAGIAVVGLVMSMAAPVGWNNYFAWFALPVFLLADRWMRTGSRRPLWLAAAWSMPFVVAPMWRMSESMWTGRNLSFGSALVASTYTITCVAGLAALAWVVRRPVAAAPLPEQEEVIDLRDPIPAVVVVRNAVGGGAELETVGAA
jgi:alpha-1,2-mannosyltransferase